jgi:hypothetical protein
MPRALGNHAIACYHFMGPPCSGDHLNSANSDKAARSPASPRLAVALQITTILMARRNYVVLELTLLRNGQP